MHKLVEKADIFIANLRPGTLKRAELDYETLSNCFVGVFQHYKNETRKVFIVHKLQNDSGELVKFLQENEEKGEWHISSNGLAFDSQITQYILLRHEKLSRLTAEEIAEKLYKKAQKIIERQDGKEFLESPEKDLKIRQIDLFKLKLNNSLLMFPRQRNRKPACAD